jgi:predicted small lipoprotein YifL
MKKIVTLLIICSAVAILYGCGSKSPVPPDNKIKVAQFVDSAEKWANKEVVIAGTVSHVCRHSGKKLFVFDGDPDKTVKIYAGGEVSAFDMKLEGADIEVTGTVIEDEKIDMNYLDEWENDIRKMVEDGEQKVCNADAKAITVQTGDTVKENEAAEDPYADVKAFRKKLEESGKTYISVYAIDCKTLKEVKEVK